MKKKSTSQSAFFNLRVLAALLVGMTGISLALFAANPLARGTSPGRPVAAKSVKPQQKYALGKSTDFQILPPGFDCSKIHQLGIDTMENFRAAPIMVVCGVEPEGKASPAKAFSKFVQSLFPAPSGVWRHGCGSNHRHRDLSIVTQSETFTTANPDNPDEILVAFNDSSGAGGSP